MKKKKNRADVDIVGDQLKGIGLIALIAVK